MPSHVRQSLMVTFSWSFPQLRVPALQGKAEDFLRTHNSRNREIKGNTKGNSKHQVSQDSQSKKTKTDELTVRTEGDLIRELLIEEVGSFSQERQDNNS